MARPSEITDAEIIAAGRTLEAGGQAVNGFRLHRGVGERGRPDRLMAVWAAYKAGLAASAGSPRELPPLPGTVRDDLASLTTAIGEQLERTVRAIADRLAGEAQGRVTTEREALARERETLAMTEADAVETVASLSDRLEVLRDQYAAVTEQLQRARVAQEAAELLRLAEAERLTATEASRADALAESARAGERAAIAERRVVDLENDLTAMRQEVQQRVADVAGAEAVIRELRTQQSAMIAHAPAANASAAGAEQRMQPRLARRRAAPVALATKPATNTADTVLPG